MTIKVKRVYEPIESDDGKRFLVERLWPRGIRKEALQLEGWLPEVAPSTPLRKWFNHDKEKWEEFRRRYFAELEAHSAAWQPLLEAARLGNITLLFSAREVNYNNAVALREFLEMHMAHQ